MMERQEPPTSTVKRVALQGKAGLRCCALQQPRIRRTVRRMAGHATFSLDGRVFPGEGAGLVRVAVEADLVLRSGGTQLVPQKTTVLVVAIAAGNQVLHSRVVERLGEIRLGFQMAAVAKVWLRRSQ